MINSNKNISPLISVIMATWNRRELLPRSINSLIVQDFTDWELIIIDDGSSDDSFCLIKTYLEKNKNIRYLKHEHCGLALSRNAGIVAAKGKYITFLDSDDELEKDHLKLRIDYMEAHQEIDLIHGGVQITGNPNVPDKIDTSRKIHLSECCIGATFFGKQEVFNELNGFANIPYSEDSDFLERAERIYKVKKVEFPTYIYHRETADSICNTIAETITTRK